MKSVFSKTNFPLTADPASPSWKGIAPAVAEGDHFGKPVPGHRTEIRSRWTADNLYLLFVCPYETLYLKENPVTGAETNKLWNWDVAEVFAGADFANIRHYREYQVSPQGEWVDLDIDRDRPKPEGGWTWNSGFKVKARIDRDRKIWYGEMRIPMRSIDTRDAAPGNQMRINFYRIQGPPPDRKFVCWQPTGARNNHVPEAFGRLELVK
ncbi:MAG: carbohydrate-binding family 9-like protein [Acidobacteria bacterium]|nr:carbohydrate-binding family 9-like protein [Acidobacteriota bacterium]